ncbi:hypothetical protein MMC06_004450 [Schaereria dolodes]|nr:hypothetical protein [Schaereria dolodes]
MDAPTQFPLSSQSVPPFELTTTHQAMTNSSGVQVHPEICAKIDKGFFKADQDWTCYRRNYFSVACSYSLQPTIDYLNERLYLYRPNSTNRDVIESLSLCITAKVDGEEGKTIDLVQHTPKRDKGPMSAPEPIKLLPHPSGVSGFYQGTSSAQHLPSDYDGIYPRSSPPQQQNQIVANFDRIQFKKATANNGKRRAAQQYFHIVVELFAETSRGKLSEKPPSIKIATRMSAPMVVRGRSPGHYQDERRGSSTSMGPGGGSSGDSGGGSRDPNVTGPSHGGHGSLSRMSFAGSTPMGGGAYQTHHAAFADSSSKSHSSASSSHGSVGSHFFHRPLEPVLTADDASGIEGPGRYQYYPGTLYETATSNNSSRPYLPPVPASVLKLNLLGYADNPPIKQDSRHKSKSFVKQEQHRRPTDEFDGFQLPSFNSHLRTGSLNGFAAAAHMNFGRFQGVETSKGYYPEMPVP